MRLSSRQLAYVCWALEEAPTELPEEEEEIAELLAIFSAAAPYSPYRSARDWRDTHS